MTRSFSVERVDTPKMGSMDPNGGIANNAFSSDDLTRNSINSSKHNSLTVPDGELEMPGFEGQDYLLSLRRLTREALPRIDLYRATNQRGNFIRPTLDELRDGKAKNGDIEQGHSTEDGSDAGGHGHVKFGWIQGVLILNIMSLWGPMLFLRTSWLVGQGGLIQAILVILFSALITLITALSTSAIATNGEIKGGGTYYMLSRSLGPEYGGAIGLIFAFANMVGVAMNIVGFCEALNDLLKNFDMKIVDGADNDVRIVGVCLAVVCIVICLVGMEWEQKAQILFFLILLASLVDVTVGSFMTPNDFKRSRGIVFWNTTLARDNLMPDYRDDNNFIKIFAVYFPSATGILSGANISGELKDPQKAIPKGTIWAILITTTSYIFMAIISGFCVYRSSDGLLETAINGTFSACEHTNSCKYGLLYNYQMLEQVSAFRWLIYAGNFAATVSSALACLVGAPRVFQALCRDRIYPFIHVFEKGYGKSDDPIRAYGVTFVIAVAFILIANLNAIAPIMSNFFMAAFCLINFAVFHAEYAKSPGWRPGFKYWNMWISAFGAILCVVVMFLMDWLTALITIVICFILYMYLYYNRPHVNWGDSAQASTYKDALKSAQDLNYVQDHVKNYRPQILVLTGKPHSRPQLVDFSYHITKGIGLTVCGHALTSSVSQNIRRYMFDQAYEWLKQRKCKAFYSLVEDESFEHAVRMMLQAVGVGKLRPNMLMLGYKSSWQLCNPNEVEEYFNVLHDAFDRNMAVGILRMRTGLDYSFYTERVTITNSGRGSTSSAESGENSGDNESNSNSAQDVGVIDNKTAKQIKRGKLEKNSDMYAKLPPDVQENINWFNGQQRKGTIDVWWLYDDGGLTLLIPYILSTRKQYQKCSLRVFSLAYGRTNLDEEHRNLAALLSKFRIDCNDVVLISDVSKSASDFTKREFDNIVSKYMVSPNQDVDDIMALTEDNLEEHKQRSNRYMRISEHLAHYSKTATLVVMTLPMPKKDRVPIALYMAWLEIMSKDMPPFMFVRGNQTSVLTFYS